MKVFPKAKEKPSEVPYRFSFILEEGEEWGKRNDIYRTINEVMPVGLSPLAQPKTVSWLTAGKESFRGPQEWGPVLYKRYVHIHISLCKGLYVMAFFLIFSLQTLLPLPGRVKQTAHQFSLDINKRMYTIKHAFQKC